MFASLPVAVIFLLSWPLGVVTSNDCQPITWANPPEARADHTKTLVVPTIAWLPDKPIKAGDINCRSYDRTYDDANYYSCKELAYKWNIRLAWFFQINPTLLPDCSNILPNTLYCIRAFIEPLRSTDGFCGPHHNNAVCRGTGAHCCNSETWTCGNTKEDCEDGRCYEGRCRGDKVYSTDGTCGPEHGDRQCAGKWGDCCNHSGRCGTGTDFCGETVCHSGNCDWKLKTTSTTTSTAATTGAAATKATFTSDPWELLQMRHIA